MAKLIPARITPGGWLNACGMSAIVNYLIKRVEVYRDYKVHVDSNIDFEQFNGGLDIVTIAA